MSCLAMMFDSLNMHGCLNEVLQFGHVNVTSSLTPHFIESTIEFNLTYDNASRFKIFATADSRSIMSNKFVELMIF